jgi:hypothetical protein
LATDVTGFTACDCLPSGDRFSRVVRVRTSPLPLDYADLVALRVASVLHRSQNLEAKNRAGHVHSPWFGNVGAPGMSAAMMLTLTVVTRPR